MRVIATLTDRSLHSILRKYRIPMTKLDSIIGAANDTRTTLAGQLGDDAAAVALAVALGKLCAESGGDLGRVLALVEVSHRETSAEAERVADGAAA